MKSIIETVSIDPLGSEEDQKLFRNSWKSYYEFIEYKRNSMPPGIKEFFDNDWHYNPKDKRALHDSWLDSFKISQRFDGQPLKARNIEVYIKLLMPYHDRYLEVTYLDVKHYKLDASHTAKLGDLMVDELSISEKEGAWTHKIAWCYGLWEIHFLDMKFQFTGIHEGL